MHDARQHVRSHLSLSNGTVALNIAAGVCRGQVTTAAAHLSKSELCAKYQIQPRDLRKLDSVRSFSLPFLHPDIYTDLHESMFRRFRQ